jgi:hypothetical protein
VIQNEGQTFIRDRIGELWNVTQAEVLGFKPQEFQYGIGKTAVAPLDDAYLTDGSSLNSQTHRVIGVADESEAIAFSVPKLRNHEIANSHIDFDNLKG